MTSQSSVAVHIYDQVYQIRADEQDPEHARQVAAYVDAKMAAVAASATRRSPLDVAVLAAMEIAQEVMELRRRKESMVDDVDQRLATVTRRLEDQRPLRGLLIP
jgi:cell division protein ZapA